MIWKFLSSFATAHVPSRVQDSVLRIGGLQQE
jgi:hypothetical protein